MCGSAACPGNIRRYRPPWRNGRIGRQTFCAAQQVTLSQTPGDQP